MNNSSDKSLDDRLRKADPASGQTFSNSDRSLTPSDRGNPVRDWWLTTSARVRRSVAGGATVAASSLVVASMALNPAGGGPLIYLAEGANQTALIGSRAGATEDKMMMPYVEYDYVADAKLSTANGRGNVYKLTLAGTAESVARSAADYFGVDGEFGKTQYFDEGWPTYVIGSEDGTAPSISVGWYGTGSWWYNNPAAYPEQECVEERRVGKGSDAYIECVEYEPAITGLNPNEADTRKLAADFFTAMGVSFTNDAIRVTVDEWGSYASVALEVDGLKTAIEWSISWSGNGEIAYAQGNSVSVTNAGEFDTISDAAAVDRLADWRWFGAGPTEFAGGIPFAAYRSSVASDTVAGAESGTDVSGGSSEPGEPTEPAPSETVEPTPGETETPVEPAPSETPVVEPTIEPEPEPTEPEVEVQTITIDSAKPALLLIWDKSGDAWLVPGVALTGTDWWWQTVITLVEGVIELPEPVGVMPID